jgi:hypothetical protein
MSLHRTADTHLALHHKRVEFSGNANVVHCIKAASNFRNCDRAPRFGHCIIASTPCGIFGRTKQTQWLTNCGALHQSLVAVHLPRGGREGEQHVYGPTASQRRPRCSCRARGCVLRRAPVERGEAIWSSAVDPVFAALKRNHDTFAAHRASTRATGEDDWPAYWTWADAQDELLATPPTTVAGLLAFINYLTWQERESRTSSTTGGSFEHSTPSGRRFAQ